MFSLEIVLASVFILNPDAEMSDAMAEVVKPTLISVALSGQIIDKREINFISLEGIQKRQNNIKDYPLLEELNRFPDSNYLKHYLHVNRKCREYLVLRKTVDSIHENLIQDAICECDGIYQIYDALRDARVEYYYINVRRESLDLLKKLIGDENYYSGKLPNPIP